MFTHGAHTTWTVSFISRLSVSLSVLAWGASLGTVHASLYDALPQDDACQLVEGAWQGKGAFSIGEGKKSLTCEYEGEGIFSPTEEQGKYQGDLALKLVKANSRGLCPAQYKARSVGNCTQGVLVLRSDYASLEGEIEPQERTAYLSGTVKIGRTKGVIKVHLQKQSPRYTKQLQHFLSFWSLDKVG